MGNYEARPEKRCWIASLFFLPLETNNFSVPKASDVTSICVIRWLRPSHILRLTHKFATPRGMFDYQAIEKLAEKHSIGPTTDWRP